MTEVNETRILDLDDFVPQERVVVINKKEFRILGTASVAITLQLMASSEALSQSTGDGKTLSKLLETVKLFFIDPITDAELGRLDLTTQMPRLIAFLYGTEIKTGETKNAPAKSE